MHERGPIKVRLSASWTACLLALGSFLFATPRPIPAPFVPDDELAQRPVIVVAKWSHRPFEDHNKTEGNVLKEWEVSTEVEVERVLQGSIKPGKHKVQLGFAIGWSTEGGPVISSMSTEQIGDVEEVLNSNLWFFSFKKSWDTTDKTEYLHLDTFRGVQPLVLEKYFGALRSKEPEKEVPALLDSKDHAVLTRVLQYISGDRLPWPFGPWEFTHPKKAKRPPLTGEASRVALLLAPGKDREIRALALAVYAELAGKDALLKLRELVSDRETVVRAIAAGLLAAQRDGDSIDALCKAASAIAPDSTGKDRMQEAHIACDLIQRCADWGELKLVPALIAFLQNDTFVYQYGDDLGIPSFKARQGLKKLTGAEFPLDIAVSAKAWDQVKDIAEKGEREKRLSSILESTTPTLAAWVVIAGKKISFVVLNSSKVKVIVAKKPGSVELRASGGVGSFGNDDPKTKADFQELDPGASFSVPLENDSDFLAHFLAAEPSSRKAVLRFLKNGNELGLNAWTGNLEAGFGDGWKEPERIVKTDEERWPNRNLKEKGPMLNGKRHGTWYFYREDGKKIREIEYFNGSISKVSELNPNYVPPEEKKK